MINTERQFVNIGPIARRLQQEGLWDDFKETQIDKSFSQMCREELVQVATDWKVERLSLASVIADRVIDRALKTTLAEATPERLPYPHTNVPSFVLHSIQTALVEEFRHLNRLINEGSQDPIVGVYIRYWEVTAKNPSEEDMRLPDNHLMIGVRTAVEVMSETYNVIGDVYKKQEGEKPTEEVQKAIAQNSFPMVSTLASMHAVDFGAVRDYIIIPAGRFDEPRFDPRKFELKESEAGLRLCLKEIPIKKGKLAELMQKLLAAPGVNPIDSAAPRTRCPALVNYGNGSAIKRLWDFYITL